MEMVGWLCSASHTSSFYTVLPHQNQTHTLCFAVLFLPCGFQLVCVWIVDHGSSPGGVNNQVQTATATQIVERRGV